MRAVINFSDIKYRRGQHRLVGTLKMHCKQDYILFQSVNEIRCKHHKDSMYGFKPKSFLKAQSLGYNSILWLDASMYVLKDLSPIFEQIETDGYFWQDSGWGNERWTTPEQKEYFGTNKGEMISSGVLGLDLTKEVGKEFLRRWDKASEDGMFNGSHEVTRHDQTCASLIINQMGLKITPNETHWVYGTPEETYSQNILLIANGII